MVGLLMSSSSTFSYVTHKLHCAAASYGSAPLPVRRIVPRREGGREGGSLEAEARGGTARGGGGGEKGMERRRGGEDVGGGGGDTFVHTSIYSCVRV